MMFMIALLITTKLLITPRDLQLRVTELINKLE